MSPGELDEALRWPGLTFEPEIHTYHMYGRRVPSVTGILTEALGGFENVRPSVLLAASSRGTLVHLATELDDLGTLDESSIGEDLKGYLQAWRRFKACAKVKVLLTERRLYHEDLKYAGTTDKIVDIGGRLSVLDVKSGSVMPSHGPQTAAYQNIVSQRLDISDIGRGCVYLRDTGEYTYKTHWDRYDWVVFMASLTVHNFRRRG
jgi:hypothetical protein